jgi:hypothetical protein
LRSTDDQAAVGVALDEVERPYQVPGQDGAVAWSTSGTANADSTTTISVVSGTAA